MAAARRGPTKPHGRMERSLSAEGFERVAGLDEVGRGAWAGPASVGVVVVHPGRRPPPGLRDSKLLPEHRREELFPLITAWCAAWSVGHVAPGECDELGMTAALRLAATRALDGLAHRPDVVLLDGIFDYLTPPKVLVERAEKEGIAVELVAEAQAGAEAAPDPHVRTVVRGDNTCVSIAAASIVAKVTRDRLMRAMSSSFPAFDFDRNKGYPSPVHRTALAGFGLTSVHRRSWSYVDDLSFR